MPPPIANAQLTRPEVNGRFYAGRAPNITLDGDFQDWPGDWIPLNAVVYGADSHTGPADLSGNFQIAWSDRGIYIAVRVNDDIYRNGPEGTDLWKGDGLEIQFDRSLAADYTDPQATADDYQIGLGFGPDLDRIIAYRWLPFAKEGPLSLPGFVSASGHGYNVESLIPWSVFDLSGTDQSVGNTYGFNISINDNDGDTPAQQTVVSASPSRTTHDNPTQWGTLFLGQ